MMFQLPRGVDKDKKPKPMSTTHVEGQTFKFVEKAPPKEWWDAPRFGAPQPETGSSKGAEIYLASTRPQTLAADVGGQQRWKKTGLLNDPTKSGNELTRMHIINGILYGPSDQRNMFLGTHGANNSQEEGHLKSVEAPIKLALENNRELYAKGADELLVCQYQVAPRFTGAPGYLKERVNRARQNATVAADPDKRTTCDDAAAWLDNACPETVDCAVRYGKLSAVDETCVLWSAWLHHTFKTDLGVSVDGHADKFAHTLAVRKV